MMGKETRPHPATVLRVAISKTLDGESDYMQIMSADSIPDPFSVNIILVGTIIVDDRRTAGQK